MTGKKDTGRPDSFTKEQILSSKRYQDRRDAISVVLEDGKSYFLAEVDEMIEKFMKGKVK